MCKHVGFLLRQSHLLFQVKHCPVCQKMNKKLMITRPELHPVPVKSAWYHIPVGMDFVGPINPTTHNGNRFILTISDYFIKFGWAKALPTNDAVNVTIVLRQVHT